MNTEKLLAEIKETNLAYLMLAQNMIREDRAQALYRLGISEEVADLIAGLSPVQMVKVAATNLLMCRFRFDDEMVWNLISGHTARDKEAKTAHAAILMAGRFAEAV